MSQAQCAQSVDSPLLLKAMVGAAGEEPWAQDRQEGRNREKDQCASVKS